MKDLIKKLFGQSSTYAVGRILTKGVGLLLLPVYTRYLTPSEYGIIAVVGIIGSILGPGLTGESRGAALKFSMSTREPSTWLLRLTALLLGSGILFLLMDLFGEEIFRLMFEETPYVPYIQMPV